MNMLFLRGLFNRKNEGPGSDYSLPDVPSEPSEPITMRDLLLSAMVFICGNFIAVVLLTTYDYHLAVQCAVVQLTVTLFLAYKLNGTLEF